MVWSLVSAPGFWMKPLGLDTRLFDLLRKLVTSQKTKNRLKNQFFCYLRPAGTGIRAFTIYIEKWDISAYLTGYSVAGKICRATPKWGTFHYFKSKIAVLCGDSIVAGLSRYPSVWSKYFRPFKAINIRIGGDRLQHGLWRAEKIVLPSSVNIVVLQYGTNNIDRGSPKEISNDIASVGVALQERKPSLKTVLSGLLPRDLNWSFRRVKTPRDE